MEPQARAAVPSVPGGLGDEIDELLDRLGARPAEALYVGDTVIDAETAVRARVPFVGVLTGIYT